MQPLPSAREPIFNVPPSVIGLLAIMVCIHALRLLLPEDAETWLVLAAAFIPSRYSGLASELPGGDVAGVTSFITHIFLHGDVLHLLVNSAWVLAFGGAVALRIGGARFLAFSLLCGAAGAVMFLVLNWGLEAQVIGASGAVSGLMGGLLRFLFSALDRGGAVLIRSQPESIPVMPLRAALTDKRILVAAGIWIAVNALTAVGIEPAGSAPIAWQAHLGGFLAGFLTFGFFVPPAIAPGTPSQPRY